MLMHATIRELRKLAKKPLDQMGPDKFSFSVRCLIEKKGEVWQGFTLEYGLAVQGESAVDVHSRLDRIVCSYVYDAVFGDDREHSEDLLTRKAAPEVYVKFYLYNLLSFLRRKGGGQSDVRAYREPLALTDGMCSPC